MPEGKMLINFLRAFKNNRKYKFTTFSDFLFSAKHLLQNNYKLIKNIIYMILLKQ